MNIANTPININDNVKKIHSIIPVDGRYIGPTSSEQITKNKPIAPGPTKPRRKRPTTNNQYQGVNDVSNGISTAKVVAGIIVRARPYLYKVNNSYN